ncbi:MAG TPA: metallophosphoesterase [Solirubrobacteraceae bacterium]|nr:metallophosphoesterase [Solirubrobacteraceae bacterium]
MSALPGEATRPGRSALRTLVVSDLHLGTHAGTDVLRDRRVRAPLLAALRDCDRLVLLGDVLELRHGPLHEALGAAREPLGEIGAALGPEGEVVLLAGNHDHYLVHPWSQRRAGDGPPPALDSETAVDWVAGDPLAALAAMLAPARVRAAYPGVWLRADVWASHGHYLDVHMTVPSIERLGAGAMRRVVSTPGTGPHPPPAAAEDYEAILTPIYAWLHAVAQGAAPGRGRGLQSGSVRGWQALTGPRGGRGIRGRAIAAAYPLVIAALNRAGLGPLRAEVSGPALRRSGLRGMGEVCAALGVSAPYVIFGHTHRAGPLPGNDPAEWVTARGSHLINSGSWVHEAAFMGPDASQSPYRTGFCIVVEDTDPPAPPRLVNLLDPDRPDLG